MGDSDSILNKSTILMLGLILLGVALLFAKGITPSFSSDDYVHLEKNIGFDNFVEATEVFLTMDGREYRPLIRFSLWLNHKMGSTAVPFHITNLLLHMACIVCLFFLLRQWTDSNACALTACLLFAFHPIHTTNVNFIMGRTGMLCALFYFLCVFTFLKDTAGHKPGRFLLSLAFFILAILAKEEAVSLPILLFALLRLHPNERCRKSLKDSIVYLLPFISILFIYCAIRFFDFHNHSEDISVYTNFNGRHMIANIIKWVVGLAYPFDLYEIRWAAETKQLAAILPNLFILGLLAMAMLYVIWASIKKLIGNRLTMIGVLWFLITLIPIMGGNAHRWYLYIPSAGLSILAMAIWQQQIWRDLRSKVWVVLLIAINICFAVEIYKQSVIWSRQSEISQSFLRQAKNMGIDKLDAFHFINMPFGYKSAFLFTFKSFRSAIAIETGKRPHITILSHVNLDDNTHIDLEQESDMMTVRMKPNSVTYLILPGLQRRFPSPNVTIAVDTYQIRVDELSSAHTVQAYDIIPAAPSDIPIFYFDGSNIQKASLAVR